MKARAAFVLVALAASVALASTSTTEGPTVYEVHKADNSIEKGAWPTTETDCLARAKAQLPGGSCVIRRPFVTTSTCADEKAPSVALVQKEVDGQKYWEIPTGAVPPPEPSDANAWAVMVWVYVHNPAWPGGFPNCWVRGFAPESTWRLNPNYPGTPILELIVPDQVATSEPPNSVEPVCGQDVTDPRCPAWVAAP